MGKVRRYRQKYHASKVKESKTEEDNVASLVKYIETKSAASNFTAKDNIFKGLNINVDELTQKLPQDFDARSVATTKSRKELKLEEQHLKKSVKLKLRRQRFLEKLDVTQQAIREAKRRKKQSKGAPVVGDLNPLKDALPSLKSLLLDRFKKDLKKPKSKPKGIQKMKKRLKQQTCDAKLMKRILKDEKFKSNPAKTITEFLKHKVAQER